MDKCLYEGYVRILHVSASPATIPAAAAQLTPFIPPVFGTTTLLTFFNIFPLTEITALSGIAPDWACVRIAGHHTNVVLIEKNGKDILNLNYKSDRRRLHLN